MMNSSEDSAFDREYRALTSGRAAVELSGWSSLSVTGSDRHKFLHNFCTNDVKSLIPGASCEACFTNVKGKIVGHGVIGCRDGELVFVGPPGQASQLIAHLDRYLIREDVALADTTTSRRFVYVVGELEEVVGTAAGIHWDLVGRASGRILEVLASEGAGAGGILADSGLAQVRANAFETARIEAGFPMFQIDFNEDNLPQEVGRDREAISFKKGCYLGQETVARIDALGHVNQQLVGVRFFADGVPPPAAELTESGSKVGHVTSAAHSPRLGAPFAIAMIRRQSSKAGQRLESAVGKCEVVPYPVTNSSNS